MHLLRNVFFAYFSACNLGKKKAYNSIKSDNVLFAVSVDVNVKGKSRGRSRVESSAEPPNFWRPHWLTDWLAGLGLRSTAVEGEGARRSSGAAAVAALQMNLCVYYCWSLVAVAVTPACVGEMYTSLLNVKQAIAVERRLIEHLRTYIDHELERMDDVRRWVTTVSAVYLFVSLVDGDVNVCTFIVSISAHLHI